MSKEENRDKLIRELQDLGKLIAPPDGEIPEETSLVADDTPHSNLPSGSGENTPTLPQDDLSVGPETVDMFVPGEAASEPESGISDDPAPAKPAEKDTAESPQKASSGATEEPEVLGSGAGNARGSGDYLGELVDELVGAVEKRLSLQSGESLPESLRDELARDIRDRLSPWWSDA
ncbi:MAG: hypothetical protein QGH58_04835 [Arenicellales bacterium]|nr:hypothetical protein [Arenicellales bacterium]MDP6552674.1 hypothetical protein [Arenicellales bacterium]MDP6791220.1 hypothetical protein [Arenicellales bacterium]MDP6917837.1 hypothetical protein [Arenicellales bacterium]